MCIIIIGNGRGKLTPAFVFERPKKNKKVVKEEEQVNSTKKKKKEGKDKVGFTQNTLTAF